MRSRFDEQLKVLNKKMIEMGAECESIIALSTKALLEGNAAGARKAKEQGHKIDQMEREIESICLKAPAPTATRSQRPSCDFRRP